MDTRQALLDAIRAAPTDDTPRLVFADWLDEFGQDDRDRATAEFIRVSCDGRTRGGYGGRGMATNGYAWVGRHWKRLVPAVTGGPAAREWFWFREGSWVTVTWRIRRPGRATVGRTSRLRFLRGFLVRAELPSILTVAVLGPLLQADQPLAKIAGPAVPAGWEG